MPVLFLIGIIIGLVMGLTGAGGALVAIPLFMEWQSMDLKGASVYSLVAAMLASLLNFWPQRKDSEMTLAFVIIVFSTLSSFMSAPWKNIFPTLGMALILALLCLYSLYAVWVPQSLQKGEGKAQRFFLRGDFVLMAIVGLFLGLITTFTGLGGGVLILPLLLNVFKLPPAKAIPTSLLAVGLSSFSSLVIQLMKPMPHIQFHGSLIYMVAGIFVSVFLVQKMMVLLKPHHVLKVRQLVFTFVVVLALVKIFTSLE
jgi:uncharacterized membrane protein YfcA